MGVIATHRMPDGTEYRATIATDPDPTEPYDDGQWPILRVEYRHYDYVATAFNQAATPYVEKFNELFERLRELRNWERYAKIFLGATQVHEWGFNRGTDYSYIAFDAKAWREAMEMDTPEFLEKLAEEKPLAEIQAWIEGDVWGVTIEARYDPDEEQGDGGWDEEESVWGYYGRQYAEETAKEQLQLAVANHKVVYRYPEHEKIAPHQSEIDAILEFLEDLDNKDYRLSKIFPRTEFDEPHLQSVPQSQHQRIVFEFFDIDYKKIEEERELTFKRLQEDAAKQAGLSIKKAQEASDK